MNKPRDEFLDLALSCGAELTGKPDGSEPIGVRFSIESWVEFDAANQEAATEAAKATGTAGELDANAEMAEVKRDVELMGVGFLVDGRRCSLDRITWFNRPGDTWLPPPPGYPVQAALQPMTMSYVQNVPDQCDRITWRGAYYHLKEGAEAARQPAPVVAGPLTTENIACMGFDTFRILQGMEPHTYTAQQIAETILARRK